MCGDLQALEMIISKKKNLENVLIFCWIENAGCVAVNGKGLLVLP